MKYERLTNQKWSKDIDLTQELGYSYIYQRLYELEDKIEQRMLIERKDKTVKISEMVEGEMYTILHEYKIRSCPDAYRNVTYTGFFEKETNKTLYFDGNVHFSKKNIIQITKAEV